MESCPSSRVIATYPKGNTKIYKIRVNRFDVRTNTPRFQQTFDPLCVVYADSSQMKNIAQKSVKHERVGDTFGTICVPIKSQIIALNDIY